MRRQIIYILILLLSLSIVTLWWPLDDSDCNATPFLVSETKKYEVHATKVVVKPWYGEHQVYAIFMVPNKYERSPFFVLTVKGVGSSCEKPFGSFQNIDGVSAAPGTHLIRDYIRTRLALRMILQGLYNQLSDKQSWTLTYPEERELGVGIGRCP